MISHFHVEGTNLQDTCQPDLVIAQLDRILSSPPLESSPSLCRFLRYVVVETLAGRSGSLKEYSLGVVAFERGDEFDPRMDPIVRVQARNLRVRLTQYYTGAGAEDPIVIELPKRTYVPIFRLSAPQPEAEPAAVEPAETAELVERQEPEPPALPPESQPIVTVGVPASATQAAPPPGGKSKATRAAIAAAALFLLAFATFWGSLPRQYHRKLHEPNPQAQDFYIRGRYLMDRQTESALHDSIDSYNRAIERDPQFAAAYAGLADAYNLLAQYGYIPPGEGMEQARRAAEHALEIDPEQAEGHVSLAAVIEAYDWNWSAAERQYRRALELNPWLPAAHLWYGMFLRDQGRLQEALPELRRAAQLEPFSVLTSVNLAHAYMIAGNYQAAAEQALHASQMVPEEVTAQVILANAYRAQSHVEQAAATLDRALLFSADNPHAISTLARAYAGRGQRDQSLRLFRQLEELAKMRYVSPFDMGSVSLVLGDEKHALDLLEEAYRQRSSGLIFLRDARFNREHRSRQFNSLIEKMHFAG